MEPQTDPQFPAVGNELLDKTNYAVADWNNKLNQGYGKHPAWNLTLIEVPLSEQSTFDSSQCDIIIDYYRKPSIPQLEFVATGITIPNFEEGKTRIEIYYLGVQVLAKYEQWTVGQTTYYTYIPEPTYTGFLAGDAQLDGTIRHEIGHSLGLGHYIVTNDELQRIIHGSEDMPSIMIPIETAIGVTYFDITPLDIAEIKSIYGFNGIGSQTPLDRYKKASLIQTDKNNYFPQDTVTIKVDTSNFDDQEYAQLMALDPANEMIDTFTVSKYESTFSFSNENQPGKYYVELIDPYKDLYDFTNFTVSNQNVPSFSPQTTPTTQSIPNWVRNTAAWWSQGQVGDDEFVKGIQYLIQNVMMKIPPTQSGVGGSQQIPSWIKKNAGWWAAGQISDDEFVKGIQYLVSVGIIKPS